jgi:hypothetical protein
VSSPSISIITSTSIIDITSSLIVTSPTTDNTESATSVSTSSSSQPTGASIQSTDAAAHLEGGTIGGIVGGILGGLLVILAVIFCMRKGLSLKWNAFKTESNVGGRTLFEDDDRINGEENGLSSQPRDSARLEKDGGDC